MDEKDGYRIDTRKQRLLNVANTVLLSLVAVPDNGGQNEDVLVAKAVRMADALIKEVENFELDG